MTCKRLSKGFSSVVNKYLLVFICLLLPVNRLSAQIRVAADRYRVEFTDKNHNEYTTDRPDEFLSERAIDRRIKQGISVTHADLPVSGYYTDSLTRMGFEVLHTSRWFNSAVIRCLAADTGKLRQFDFIKRTRSEQREITTDTDTIVDTNLSNFFSFLFRKDQVENVSYAASANYYGKSATQIGMLNGQVLHNNGFRGKGILVAVIDAGFYKVDELSGFNSLKEEGRLRGVKDFTMDMDGIYGENTHGTNVLSILAADLPGKMIGSAPDADYILLRSEETSGEHLVEEDNWIAAIEYADSAGVDLVSSSLGYSQFDEPLQNHSRQDLDGRTVRISQAATMAAQRGILVCISAGNDGDLSWKYVSVPADADSIITIGSVDSDRKYSAFSSIGNTIDGRIKPDLTAMGKQTAYQNSSGGINNGNGTSYSTPLLAGLIACVWQAFPDKGNMEIIELVKQTADHYQTPDSLYGYGIPDFSRLPANKPDELYGKQPANKMSACFDPVTDELVLYLSPANHGNITISAFTTMGEQVYVHQQYQPGFSSFEFQLDGGARFDAGIYFVKAFTDAGCFIHRVIKL